LLSISFDVDEFRAHRMPTGDLFKSLALQVSRSGAFERIIFQKKWARYYGAGELSTGTIWNRKLLRDSSLSPSETRIHTTLDVPETGPIFVRLIHFYHDEELGGHTSLPSAEREFVIWEKRAR